jgi:hypothetical protein
MPQGGCANSDKNGDLDLEGVAVWYVCWASLRSSTTLHLQVLWHSEFVRQSGVTGLLIYSVSWLSLSFSCFFIES